MTGPESGYAADADMSKRPIKVLHVVNRWACGGVERYIENLMLADPDGFEQSVLSICTPVGSSVVERGSGPLVGSDSMFSMLAGSRKLKAFLSQRDYDIVHVHTNNASGFLYARAARAAGVKRRIVHSHNSSLGQDAGFLKRAAQKAASFIFQGSETDRLACSRVAGEHLFGKASFAVIPNGIDTKRFSFDSAARRRIRGNLSIGDERVVVGCVGSLIEVKNHRRAIDVFSVYHQNNPLSKLLIVGEGELRSRLEELAESKGLSKDVIFTGLVENTSEYYSAMDVLLFPSLFEGLPLTLVEAQCNGLPVVASDAVSPEAKLLESCTFLPLEATDEIWGEALSCAGRDCSEGSRRVVEAKGYDVSCVGRLLGNLYERRGESV